MVRNSRIHSRSLKTELENPSIHLHHGPALVPVLLGVYSTEHVFTSYDTVGFRVSPGERNEMGCRKRLMNLLCSFVILLVNGDHRIRGRQFKTGQCRDVMSHIHPDCPPRSLPTLESVRSR